MEIIKFSLFSDFRRHKDEMFSLRCFFYSPVGIIPGMAGEGKFSIMHWNNRPGMEVFCCLRTFFGHNMDVAPVFIVLATFYKSQVKGTESIPDFLKVASITGISCIVHLPFRCEEGKAGPEGGIFCKRSAGKMLGRKHIDEKVIAYMDFSAPILFVDFFLPDTPTAPDRHRCPADTPLPSLCPSVLSLYHNPDGPSDRG